MKTLNEYLELPYTIELQNSPDEGWFVRVKELPGCMSQGDTAEEALEMIQDAMQGWLEIALEDGIPIPEPRPEEAYSGKFVVRVPKSLHRQLVEQAETEGVSLNQYINVALSGYLAGGIVPIKSERDKDAGEVNERLFLEWAVEVFSSIEYAWRNDDYPDALRQLEDFRSDLCQHIDRSPIIEMLVMALEFQRELIERGFRLQQAIVKQSIEPQIKNRIHNVFPSKRETQDLVGRTTTRGQSGAEGYWQQKGFDVSDEFIHLGRRREE